MTHRVVIADVGFDPVTIEQASRIVIELARRRPMSIVVTANVDHVVLTHRDPPFADAIAGAELVVADGQPIVWASRLGRRRLPERVAGADLLPAVASLAAEAGLSLFLLGATAESCRGAATRLAETVPGLRIAGTLSPHRDELDDEALVERVNRAAPDILAVAFGAPLQETWLARRRASLDVGVAIGVGGTFDLLSGLRRRAPVAVQRLGLEWAYRLSQEPRRLWRRYLVRDPVFAFYLVRSWLRNRPS